MSRGAVGGGGTVGVGDVSGSGPPRWGRSRRGRRVGDGRRHRRIRSWGRAPGRAMEMGCGGGEIDGAVAMMGGEASEMAHGR